MNPRRDSLCGRTVRFQILIDKNSLNGYDFRNPLRLVQGFTPRLKGERSMKRLISILCFLLIAAVVFFGTAILQAQPYPAHPIQLVIPGAPGDAVDIAARSVADELAKILNIPIIPLNKPGGGSILGTEFAVKSKKDGYTLLYPLSSGLIYNPAMN